MRGLSPLLVLGLLLGFLTGARASAQDAAPPAAPEAPTPPGDGLAPEAPGTGDTPPEGTRTLLWDRRRLEHLPREASGTSWQPDSTPVNTVRLQARAWDFLLGFNLMAGYDAQTSPRGGHQWLSTNWFSMLLGRKMQGGDFTGRVELSAEPLTLLSNEPVTAGARGYPLLFQTGQTYANVPLVDVQHPQDFFMELALAYQHLLDKDLGLAFYVAPAGEPALGPVSYLHRASALANPFAPLSRGWLEATHVSFGVFTGGVYTRLWKLEASWFNGRQPNENRWDLEFASLDSVSARFSLNPTEHLSAQVSYGYLRSPDPRNPGPVQRVTASVLAGVPLGGGGHWASTLAWGRNLTTGGASDALLLESTLGLGANHALFGRAELVVKPARALQLPVPEDAPEPAYPVAAVTLGYLFQLRLAGPLQVGIGACGTVNFVPPGLVPVYGARPLGGMAYLRLGFAPRAPVSGSPPSSVGPEGRSP